ncbi:hypothetical protein [Vibrio splendidus]|uniref:hypothetical protein n=1 Tax=Vibrio splendidus TaxID=29497 RepID=UPI000C846F29|nr:hypothetical protein [Vibrio splendidus]PMO48562.1 hypothetical protein BCT08_07730 [Vibrio splendidus]
MNLKSAGSLEKMFSLYTNGNQKNYISNCDQTALMYVNDKNKLPIVINNGEINDMYLSSPKVNYIDYNLDYIRRMGKGVIKSMLIFIISLLSYILTLCNINRVVYINNFLIPNIPKNNLSESKVLDIICEFKNNFPRHAIIFKGANVETNKNNIMCLLSKKAYIWSPSILKESGKKAVKIRKTLKSDKKNIDNGVLSFEILNYIDIKESENIRNLYRNLYHNKYSSYSADYTALWFKTLSDPENGFSLVGVKHSNELVGFVSYHIGSEMIYSGLVGHKDINGKLGVYRASIRYLIQQSEYLNKPLHLSSGAGEFKTRRGAKAHMEYDLVATDHLPAVQKMGWWLLTKIYNSLGLKIMTNMKV